MESMNNTVPLMGLSKQPWLESVSQYAYLQVSHVQHQMTWMLSGLAFALLMVWWTLGAKKQVCHSPCSSTRMC